jgi:uncharacterized protein YjbJ (UPF0337 family)
MNTDVLKGKWNQLKGEVKVQWSKLTDDELDRIDGETDKLVGVIQERYGYARQRAADEVNRFLERQEREPGGSRGTNVTH